MTLTVEPAARVSHSRRRLVAVLAVVAVLCLLTGGRTLWRDYQNRAPYGPAVVGARLSLTVVSAPEAGRLLETMVGRGKETPIYPSGDDESLRTNFVGRLTLAGPDPARGHGFYAFFLIDKAAGRAVPFL